MVEHQSDRYSSEGIYREETLYYDLGYRFAQLRGRQPKLAIDRDLTFYLLLISILLHFILNINQFYTLLILFSFILFRSFLMTGSSLKIDRLFTIMLIISNVVDHQLGKAISKPGGLFDEKLTFIVWIFELIWIMIFGIQVFILLQPLTPVISTNSSVQPETLEANAKYDQLIKRLHGTEYALTQAAEQIDIQRLKTTYNGIIRYVLLLTGFVVLFNILLWRIIGSFGGGNNILEEYFFSGMSLILFSMLILFSNLVFPDREIDNIDQNGDGK